MTAAHVESPTGTVEFLHGLYDGIEDGWLTLFVLDRRSGQRRTLWRHVTDIDALAADALAQRDYCVWFGVATRREKLPDGARGGLTDCVEIPGLWVDIDIVGDNHARADYPPDLDAAHALLEDFPLPASCVVATGGGLQAWWRFDEPRRCDESVGLLSAWGTTWAELARRRGWHVDNVFEMARVMRLPGTTNTKGMQ
jgi:hypothetical protein